MLEELVKKKKNEYKSYESTKLCSCKLLHLFVYLWSTHSIITLAHSGITLRKIILRTSYGNIS